MGAAGKTKNLFMSHDGLYQTGPATVTADNASIFPICFKGRRKIDETADPGMANYPAIGKMADKFR